MRDAVQAMAVTPSRRGVSWSVLSGRRSPPDKGPSGNKCTILNADASRGLRCSCLHTPGMRAPRASPGGRLDVQNGTLIPEGPKSTEVVRHVSDRCVNTLRASSGVIAAALRAGNHVAKIAARPITPTATPKLGASCVGDAKQLIVQHRAATTAPATRWRVPRSPCDTPRGDERHHLPGTRRRGRAARRTHTAAAASRRRDAYTPTDASTARPRQTPPPAFDANRCAARAPTT